MTASASRNLGDVVRIADGASYRDLADGRCLVAAELDQIAGRLAAGLGQRFRRGDRVALLGANGIPFTLAYLALLRAGLVAVPVNYRLSCETISLILEDSGAQTVLADLDRLPLVPSGFPLLELEKVEMLAAAEPTSAVRPELGEIAEILYTSGSTGRPKGVPLSHDGQLWALESFLAGPRTMERTIVVAPTYHMNGLFFTTVALAQGYRIVSMPRFDARLFLETVAAEGSTLLSGIPTMFAMMAREQELASQLDLSSVRAITLGSAPLTDALVDRVRELFPNATVANGYGTTETGPAMFGSHPTGLPKPGLALGYPYAGVDWRLSDGDSPNEGVLEVRTPAMLSEYLNLPSATAERLRDGWYRTGDVMRRDENGFFYFIGREDDMFVCGGENVYPGEVEKLIERHPDVLQVAVVPVENAIKGMVPVAFVVPRPGRTVEADEVKRFALANGPAFSHPRRVHVIDSLSVNGAHKIDRAILLKLARENAPVHS